MNTTLLIVGLLSGAPLESGWHHQYQGQLTDRSDAVAKRFTLECVVVADGVYWTIDEKGSGQWPWSSKFGKWTSVDDVSPSLLLRTDDITAVIELPEIQYDPPKPFAEGASWKVDGRSYRVQRHKQQWRVEGRDAYGLTTAALVASAEPLLQHYERDVVVGRGDRYQLSLKLTKSESVSEESIGIVQRQYDELLELRRTMGRSDRVRENHWSKEQLTLIRSKLPKMAALGMQTVLAEAADELRTQDTRTNALAKMKKDALGKVIDLNFTLTKLGAARLEAEQLKGKVVVLHFWTYETKPLEEPYGQVGYVDFLFRKLPADKAAVLGVVAPNQERDPAAEAREARKLTQFMNIGFPVALDNGALAKLGNPVQAGGVLPLFVVIGKDGRVLHYHPGNYEVDPKEGLKELKDVVTAAIDS